MITDIMLQEWQGLEDWQRLARMGDEIGRKRYSVDMARYVEVSLGPCGCPYGACARCQGEEQLVGYQFTPEGDAQVAANARPFLEGRARQLEEIMERRPDLEMLLRPAHNSLQTASKSMTAGDFMTADKALDRAEKCVAAAIPLSMSKEEIRIQAARREAAQVIVGPGRDPLEPHGGRFGLIQGTAERASGLAKAGEMQRAQGLLKRVVELAKGLMRDLSQEQEPDRSRSR